MCHPSKHFKDQKNRLILDVVSFLFHLRWGNTPIDEAVHFGHHDVVTILRDYHNQYSPQEVPADKETAEKNLDGLL